MDLDDTYYICIIVICICHKTKKNYEYVSESFHVIAGEALFYIISKIKRDTAIHIFTLIIYYDNFH